MSSNNGVFTLIGPKFSDIIHRHPFLLEIPSDILMKIDFGALYLPVGIDKEAVAGLAAELDRNIVVYLKNYTCIGLHLCQTIQPALLIDKELNHTKTVEKH